MALAYVFSINVINLIFLLKLDSSVNVLTHLFLISTNVLPDGLRIQYLVILESFHEKQGGLHPSSFTFKNNKNKKLT